MVFDVVVVGSPIRSEATVKQSHESHHVSMPRHTPNRPMGAIELSSGNMVGSAPPRKAIEFVTLSFGKRHARQRCPISLRRREIREADRDAGD
ncbi:hypothetical protein MTO96_039604, partial [Rhipicephalus appendiculatus]